MLSSPPNAAVLRALADGAKTQADLRLKAGLPAQSTLRAQLVRLTAIRAIEKRRRNQFPGTLEYELTPPGRALMPVIDAVECWLRLGPQGALTLGSNPAKAAVKTLTEGWSTAILHALATRPMSLTELDRMIPELSYPSLERRLATLRLAAQVEPLPGNGRGIPYSVTTWAREGTAPLAAAAKWERHHLQHPPAIGRREAEALLLLSTPLIRAPAEASGSCQVGVELRGRDGPRIAGATISIRHGRVEPSAPNLRGRPDAWALGSAGGLLAALVENDTDSMEIGGDGSLARTVLRSLHEALFGAGSKTKAPRP